MPEKAIWPSHPPEMARLDSSDADRIAVSLFTGGIDRDYTFGLSMELIAKGAHLDVIGSDGVDCPEFHDNPRMNFLNLQTNQRSQASLIKKIFRLCGYYAKLIRYSASAKTRIFHILWNNKFELFDRTMLMLFYKLLGKRLVRTVHNVNAGKRDLKDTPVNRITLRMQYQLADHLFVHTEKMKCELMNEFGVRATKVSVIPYGINNATPNTSISRDQARKRLGVLDGKKTILFFGRIAEYKGLEYLITAFQLLLERRDDYQLIIAGRPENDYVKSWNVIQQKMAENVRGRRILIRAEHVPDDQTEFYFKAADVLVLPYTHIYQSGVLFLAYSFGLPVLASDVGALSEEIVEGETGSIFNPKDPVDLAATIERYFASNLFANLSVQRQKIKDFAIERHSWNVVGQLTMEVYKTLLRSDSTEEFVNRESKTSQGTRTIFHD
jgi:glycosyltransferase involved in cell wall biosynthesis